MSPGSTRTGGVLERMILPALDQGGYAYETQVLLGQRLGLGRHVVDAVAHKDARHVLISLKWQQVSGTAEQKVPFEVICLLEALQTGKYDKAYLVLGGDVRGLRQDGMTMLFATHEMSFAHEISDRVCFLDGGRIIEAGAPEMIFEAPTEDRTRRFLQRVIEATPGVGLRRRVRDPQTAAGAVVDTKSADCG